MLSDIVATKKQQLEGINQKRMIEKIKVAARDLPPTKSLKKSLCKDQSISLIAEIKRHSPSRGILSENLEVDKMASLYEKAGASAISVLTESSYFDGSIDDLQTAKENSTLPILRKDFILEEFQIWESRFIGADAILLIAGLLDSGKLRHFYRLAKQLELEVLFEVHCSSELDSIIRLYPQIIGINNRNLKTFDVNLETSEALAPHIPPYIIRVSESGFHNREDIIRMEKACLDAVLIGEAIISNPDPALKIRKLMGKE